MHLQKNIPCLTFVLLCVGALLAHAQIPNKHALLVGINKYPGNPLHGCVDDVKRMQKALVTEFDFPEANTQVLLDEQATRDGIYNGIKSFQGKIKSGDTFVFYYSGHGSLFPDNLSLEIDEPTALPEIRDPKTGEVIAPAGKYDSALCPIDVRVKNTNRNWGNFILDDELFAWFSDFTKIGCNVILVSDSCHSGSLSRGLDNWRVKSLSTKDALPVALKSLQPLPNARAVKSRDMNGKYLAITSSLDTQTSAEVEVEGQPRGAFTFALLTMIDIGRKKVGKGKITYQQAFPEIHSFLKNNTRNKQEPQIDTRYFNGQLNVPLFSFIPRDEAAANTPTPTNNPSPTPDPNQEFRFILKTENEAAAPLDKCSFIVFKPGMYAEKGAIKKEYALILGRTGADGIYDSGAEAPVIKAGVYKFKLVRDGYQSIVGDLELKHDGKGDIFMILVKMEKEK